jgi:hypothetical protein
MINAGTVTRLSIITAMMQAGPPIPCPRAIEAPIRPRTSAKAPKNALKHCLVELLPPVNSFPGWRVRESDVVRLKLPAPPRRGSQARVATQRMESGVLGAQSGSGLLPLGLGLQTSRDPWRTR